MILAEGASPLRTLKTQSFLLIGNNEVVVGDLTVNYLARSHWEASHSGDRRELSGRLHNLTYEGMNNMRGWGGDEGIIQL